jgi:hypothetical protein
VQDVINANLTASERRFDNFEAVPERPDVPNKFKSIDLFKVILMQQVLISSTDQRRITLLAMVLCRCM